MTAVTLAAVRLAPVLGDVAGNRARAAAASPTPRRAAPTSWCCPELATSGYCFADVAEARAAAEPVPGPTTDAWAAVAAETGVVVVGGICELDRRRRACATRPWSSAPTDSWPATASCTSGAARPSCSRPATRRRPCRHAGRAHRHRRLLRPLVPRARARAGARRRGDPRLPEQPLALARPAGAAAPGRRDRPRHGAREPRARRGRRSLRHRARPPLARRRAGRRRRRRPAGASVPDDDRPAVALATLDLAAARDKRWGEWNDVLADRRPGLYGSRRFRSPLGACRIGNRRCRTASSLARRRGVRRPRAPCLAPAPCGRSAKSVANAATVQRRG